MISTYHEVEGRKLFESVDYDYMTQKDITCATPSQIGCLMSLIKNHIFQDGGRINTVVEVGVSSGMTSMYMLKAGSDRSDFILYGIEKATGEYYGHAAYEGCSNNELKHWSFYTGKTASDIEDIIKDKKIDMVFIDGMHAHPGALIDFIMLYPFMRKDGIVILHDVEIYGVTSELGACYFYTGWMGKKRLNYYVDSEGEMHGTEYMGILSLERNKDEVFRDLIDIAMQPITGATFSYSNNEDPLGISIDDIDISLRAFMNKYYDEEFVSEFIGVLVSNLKDYKHKWIYYKHMNRIANESAEYELTEIDSIIFDKYENIAIWGAGHIGKLLINSIHRSGMKSKVMVWVDSNINNDNVYNPEYLKDYEFQKLIIAVKSRELFYEIRRKAVELGVPKDKTMWVYDRL
ncbi:MAG: class I SAM-dependent methyltransferase [Lachnospiraceae bacterium]|nr:class I SAM-dependent methyltransferase [Lachnospiraceae bacterium]